MNVYDAHAESLEQLQNEFGADCPQFTWNAADYKALPGGARRRKDLGIGGFSLDSDLSITCLVEQFATTAQAQRDAMLNTRLIYLGQNYKIDAIAIAPGGKQIHLQCSDAQQGV